MTRREARPIKRTTRIYDLRGHYGNEIREPWFRPGDRCLRAATPEVELGPAEVVVVRVSGPYSVRDASDRNDPWLYYVYEPERDVTYPTCGCHLKAIEAAEGAPFLGPRKAPRLSGLS